MNTLKTIIKNFAIISKYMIFSAFLISTTTSLGQQWSDQPIYKQVLPDGEVIYSHQPAPGAQKVTVEPSRPAQQQNKDAQSTPSSTDMQTPSLDSQPDLSPARYEIQFEQPKNEQVYPMGEPQVSVKLAITPALYASDRIQLFIDEQPYGKLQSDLNYTLSDLNRGQHSLQAKVYPNPKGASNPGTSKGETETVIIHVQRASINSPAR